MTQVKIINRVASDFGMVPRALWQMDISANAKLCAAYLFCLCDGAAPYVAQIEAETGLGRDARRKAFAVLEAKGIIRWHIERDKVSRIVAKSLEIDYLPVIAASRAPEIPADGEPVAAGAASRPYGDGKSGDLLRKEKKQTRRRAARPSERPAATSAKAQSGDREAGFALALGALAPVPSRLEGKRRLFQGPDGQWHERPRDPEEAKLFEAWCLSGKRHAARRAG